MNTRSKSSSKALKIALFATGISGIVAEYVLSTLASYFIGNAVVQFSLIVSTMLFSMGVGSRLSQYIVKDILVKFIYLELLLSVLVSFCAVVVYVTYGKYSPLFIYALASVIGFLIGLEIPLVTRLNDSFEELKVNIASVLEKDYYGSLIGGVFFAFVGIPYLGLTYTPFVLGLLNYSVALWLFLKLQHLIDKKFIKKLYGLFSIIGVAIVVGMYLARPLVLYGDQKKYRDKIVFQEETPYQKIVITQWKDDYSLFINGNLQFSSFDEFMYHEPLVHSVFAVSNRAENILVLGGGDGCAVREVLKHSSVKNITLVDLDPAMTRISKHLTALKEMNSNALNSKKVSIIHQDAFRFLEQDTAKYDVVIIDLPDPNNVDLNKLYTREFYFLCSKRLSRNGIIITQAGSPYYATKAFYCIEKSMKAAGFNTLPMHTQILTMGEWGWIIGSLSLRSNEIQNKISSFDFNAMELRWLNNDAARSLFLFGKPLADTTGIAVNTLFSPVLYTYYRSGNWQLY